jgi:site-specific DNA-cytosine methylase
LLKAIKPKYFLLENVRMKKVFLQVISEQVSACYPEIVFGIEPIFINSSLVSAQSRQRYYWTNMPNIKQPEDSGIVLKDILEENFDSERDKAHCIDANYYKGASVEQYKTKHRRQLVNKPIKLAGEKGNHYGGGLFDTKGKSPTLNGIGNGGGGTNNIPKVVTGGAFRGRAYDKDGKRKDRDGKSVANQTKQMLELRQDSKSNAITTVGKDSIVVEKSNNLEFSHGLEQGRRIDDGKKLSRNYSEGYRVYKTNGKSATITAQSKGGHGGHAGLYGDELHWRKLTPLECERLQTVPDNYTNHVSNTQRYKMLGNGWTVAVIKHIFQNMERE